MQEAKRIASQALNFAVVDNVLYSIDLRGGGRKQAAVPSVLQTSIMEMYQGGRMAGHFSGASFISYSQSEVVVAHNV